MARIRKISFDGLKARAGLRGSSPEKTYSMVLLLLIIAPLALFLCAMYYLPLGEFTSAIGIAGVGAGIMLVAYGYFAGGDDLMLIGAAVQLVGYGISCIGWLKLEDPLVLALVLGFPLFAVGQYEVAQSLVTHRNAMIRLRDGMQDERRELYVLLHRRVKAIASVLSASFLITFSLLFSLAYLQNLVPNTEILLLGIFGVIILGGSTALLVFIGGNVKEEADTGQV